MRLPILLFLAILAAPPLLAQRALNAPPTGAAPAAAFTVRVIGGPSPRLEVAAPGKPASSFLLRRTAGDGDADTLLRLADAGQEGTILATLEPVHDLYEAEATRGGRTGDLTGFINLLAEGADSTAGVQMHPPADPAAAEEARGGSNGWGLAIGALILGIILGAIVGGALYRRMKKGGESSSGGRTRSPKELTALVEKLSEENDRLRERGASTATTGSDADAPTSKSKTADARKGAKAAGDSADDTTRATAETGRLRAEIESIRASEDALKKALAETRDALRRAQQESKAFEDRADRYDEFFSALLQRRVTPFFNWVQSGDFNSADPAQRARFAAELLALGWIAVNAARFFAKGHTPSAPERYNMKDLVSLDGEVRAPQPISAADARSGESGVILAMADLLRTLGIRSIGDVSIENRRFE